MDEGLKKDKVRQRLFYLKQKFHTSESGMKSTIGDLEWYLKFKQSDQQSSNDDRLGVLNKIYQEFSNEELEELIDQLKAD